MCPNLGGQSATTGLIVASSSLVGILISFYGGALSDFFGRRKVILTSVFYWLLYKSV